MNSIQSRRSIVERSVSVLLLLLILIFALNSIGNVQKYVAQFHEHWTGSVLGVAFGTVVFVCAYIAATTYGSTRWLSITISTIFGIASAQFQTELYVSEGMALRTALALSYIPIVAGEVGLAMLESLYSQQNIERQQPTSLESTLSERLEPVLEREFEEAETIVGNLNVPEETTPSLANTKPLKRKTKTRTTKQERQTQLLKLLKQIEHQDAIDPSTLAAQVSASVQTVYRDLGQLKEDGRLKFEDGRVIV